MADRTSPGIFSSIFTKLAEDINANSANRAYAQTVAQHMWGQMRSYDFSNDQLGCDEALITLGLARNTEEGVQYRTLDLRGWEE